MAEEMKSIGPAELKVLQMDVLETLAEFLAGKGIPYSLACGTMLGAVRHKGYIPWDDDIDIYLLRADYDRLMRDFPQEYKHVRIASLERTPRWDKPYAKAYDERTVFVEHNNSRMRIGINIDLFPLDAVPDQAQDWLRYNRRRRFWQKLLQMKMTRPDPRRSRTKNLALRAVQLLLLPVSAHCFAAFLDRLARRYDGQRTEWLFETAMGLIQKDRFPRRVSQSLADYPFEDRMFRGFADADTYLSCAYGDYRKLPSEEKRVSHHDFQAWWR